MKLKDLNDKRLLGLCEYVMCYDDDNGIHCAQIAFFSEDCANLSSTNHSSDQLNWLINGLRNLMENAKNRFAL